MADESTPLLSIRLFGPFEARVNGQPLPRLRTRKVQWLLALLTLRAGRPVERDWLAGLLWPASPERAALTSLRNSLLDLRHALGLATERLQAPNTRTLCLHLAPKEADVLAFDAAIARGDPTSLEAAVALYRGPLLEGCVEAWAFQERQAREEAYLNALARLADDAMARGATAAAEQRLRKAVAVDPLRETTQRGLMAALAAGGNYAAALGVYRELRRLLHRELNAEPDAQTRQLFEQIRAEARSKAGGRRQAPHASKVNIRDSRPCLSVSDPATGVWRLAPAPGHNLPLQLTSFIGRGPQRQEIVALLDRHRLVTLTGAGGCGKTRLAIELAADLLECYPDGVWLVELAALSDPARVPQTVAATLGLREKPGHPLTETLIEYLGARALLLVLDNCEHLLAACGQLTNSLLGSCPHLRILATSREALGIEGEQTYRVPSLSLPPAVDGSWLIVDGPAKTDSAPPSTINHQLPTINQYEAIHLFAERARLSQSTFAVTAANAAAVVRICQRLDRIPLAIELAARRVKALPVEEIVQRLDDRFQLLTSGSRTALPRQQTLRATLDWSHDLLMPAERTLLRRLSVFAGGFTLAAAEAICADPVDSGGLIVDGSDRPELSPITYHLSTINHRLSTDDVLDLLISLVEKSLVVYDEQGTEARYRLLETVRQYARERLLEAAEASVLQDQHREWFLALVEDTDSALNGPSASEWLEKLEREHDNLRAALAWCATAVVSGQWSVVRAGKDTDEGEPVSDLAGLTTDHWPPTTAVESGLRLGVALWVFWQVRGYFGEGREHLTRLLALPGARGRTEARAAALHAAGRLVWQQGDCKAARAFFEESLAIFRELGDRGGIAMSLGGLGWVAREAGDPAAGLALDEESLAICRELGHKGSIGWSLIRMAIGARQQGDYERARALDEESMPIFREIGNRRGIAWAVNGLGIAARVRGEYGPARALVEVSLSIFHDLGDRSGILMELEELAAVDVAQAQPERAARLLGAAEALSEVIGTPVWPAQRAEHERSTAAARSALGEEAFAGAWAAGQNRTLDTAIQDALSSWQSG